MLGIHSHIGCKYLKQLVLFERLKFFANFRSERANKLCSKSVECRWGFGIRYTESDTPLTLETYVRAVTSAVREQFTVREYPLPEIWIEPGRSIVGDAGTTIYTVGCVKDIPGIRKYVSVDGGMTDNLRPALYSARYEAMLANRGNDENEELVSIAGKCCESGDMLIWDIHLPKVALLIY